jgi:hypothetical protein
MPVYQPWPPTTYYPVSPCTWSYYGCGGWNYPGWGDVGIGKPILYVHGPVGTPVRISLRFQAESHLLAASPAHGRGWELTVDAQGLNSASGRYSSVFYDLRTHSKLLSADSAFCVAKDDLLTSLENYLRNRGFEDREVSDFHDSWDGRFPPAARYCVYPQEGAVVDQVAELVVEPKPTSVIRVWFLVVPEREPTGKVVAFSKFIGFKRKASPTVLALLKRNAKRALAQASAPARLELHEWGIGFLFETKAK